MLTILLNVMVALTPSRSHSPGCETSAPTTAESSGRRANALSLRHGHGADRAALGEPARDNLVGVLGGLNGCGSVGRHRSGRGGGARGGWRGEASVGGGRDE